MKIRSLFDLLQDSRDVLDFFDRVETTEQMVSVLERLKRNSPEDFHACIEALRMSVDATLEDVLEMSSGKNQIEDEDLDEDELADLEDEPAKSENPEEKPVAETKT